TIMKARELRIGNYIQDRNGKSCKVEELANNKIEAFSGMVTPLPLEPTPLNKDWLLMFGFKEDAHFGNWHLSEFEIYSLGSFHAALKDSVVYWYNESLDDYYSSVKELKY